MRSFPEVQRGRAHERSKGFEGASRRDLSVQSAAVSADRAAGGGADRLSAALPGGTRDRRFATQ